MSHWLKAINQVYGMIADTRVFWQLCGGFRGNHVCKLEIFQRNYDGGLICTTNASSPLSTAAATNSFRSMISNQRVVGRALAAV